MQTLKLSKFFSSLVICLIGLFSMTGCAGMIARGMVTSHESFEEVSSRAGNIAEGKARIWVYTLGGGPNLGDTLGGNGNINFNKIACEYFSDCFARFDLPSGHYTITTSDTAVFGGPKPGINRKELQFDPGSESFIRIQYEKELLHDANAAFDRVSREQALNEMKGLLHYKADDRMRQIKD